MIISDLGDRDRFVTQPEHAGVAATFARHWGNETVESPTPSSPIVMATELHDHGWIDYDTHPHLDDGTLVDFIDTPADTWCDFYSAGVDRVAEIDPYAGLIASMHASGLRRQGYGQRPSIPDLTTDERYVRFVAAEERRQRTLLSELLNATEDEAVLPAGESAVLQELHETGSYDGTSRLWYNFNLIQVFDLLSLYICNTYPLAEYRIGSVPLGYDRALSELAITPDGESTVRLRPYPFDTAPLSVSVVGRVVPRTWATEEELRSQYFEAEREVFTVRFERP